MTTIKLLAEETISLCVEENVKVDSIQYYRHVPTIFSIVELLGFLLLVTFFKKKRDQDKHQTINEMETFSSSFLFWFVFVLLPCSPFCQLTDKREA